MPIDPQGPGLSLDPHGDEAISEILSEVACDEDRMLIMDVLNAIRVCRHPDRLCTSWTVSPLDGTGYTLLAYLPRAQSQHVEVTHDDINLVESVNLLRVRVGVAQFAQVGSHCLPLWLLYLFACKLTTTTPRATGPSR